MQILINVLLAGIYSKMEKELEGKRRLAEGQISKSRWEGTTIFKNWLNTNRNGISWQNPYKKLFDVNC